MDNIEIDRSRIKNKKVSGCIICQNPKLSKIIDPQLFEAEVTPRELKERLAGSGIFLEISDLNRHKTHIYYDDTDTVEIDQLKETLKNLNNKERIDNALIEVNIKKSQLLKNNNGNSEEFFKLCKLETDLLNLKARVDGDMEIKPEQTGIPTFIQIIKKDTIKNKVLEDNECIE